MTDGSHGLPDGIERPEALLVTGLGPLFRAESGGRPVLVLLLQGVSRRGFTAAELQRLASPPHPVLLPVEVREAGTGAAAVAPLDGIPLALADPSFRLLPRQAVEAGLSLVSAARALEAVGGVLGPLTPANVLVGSPAVPPLRVLPLSSFFPGPSGIAAHSPTDLLFVDRDTLRGAPGPGSAAFAIGALLLRATRGSEAFPTVPETARALVREVVLESHPLAAASLPEGPLAPPLSVALRGGEATSTPLAALADALQRVASGADPLVRALSFAAGGDRLAALAVLHRSDSTAPSLAALLLRARIEESLGHRERAARSLRAARAAYPSCSAATEGLSRLSSDALEASSCHDEASRCPSSPRRRLGRAERAIASGRLGEATAALEQIRLEAVLDPSISRHALAASLALVRPLCEAGAHAAALALLASQRGETDPVEDAGLEAERDEARGRSHFALGEWEEAASAFRGAVDHDARARGAPRPYLLGELAHALVAAGRRQEARAAVLRSLELDPSQDGMRRLQAALSEDET